MANAYRSASSAPSIILRSVAFFGFWLVLAGAQAADLPAGIISAAVAAWVSLYLMPPQSWSVRPAKVAGFVLRFIYQSIVAGIDVAWRAVNPRMPIRPGFVIYHPRLPPGAKRETFCAIMSLMPGTLPSGPVDGGGLAVHCLDVTQPVTQQLAVAEAHFEQAFGGAPGNG